MNETKKVTFLIESGLLSHSLHWITYVRLITPRPVDPLSPALVCQRVPESKQQNRRVPIFYRVGDDKFDYYTVAKKLQIITFNDLQ